MLSAQYVKIMSAAFYDRLASTQSSGVGLQPWQHKPDTSE